MISAQEKESKLSIKGGFWDLILWMGGGRCSQKFMGQKVHLFNGVAPAPCASIKEIAGDVIECNGLGSKLVEML